MAQPQRFTLAITSAFDWPFFLRYFRARSTPGVECVTDRGYLRAIELDGTVALMQVEHRTTPRQLVTRVDGPKPLNAAAVKSRIARMFDLSADMRSIRRTLLADARLSSCIRAAPGLRVPGAWSAFEVLVRAIVGQQISVKGATTIMGRIAERFGRRIDLEGPDGVRFLFPTPAAIAEGDFDRIGMPQKRVEALRNVARAIDRRTIPFPDDGGASAGVKAALLELDGIGPWTAEYFAMRALRDGDAWPGTDLVLRRACSEKDAQCWRPWRAYAAVHLWNDAHRRSMLQRGG